MADPSNGITFRTIQEAMPEYHISNALLDCVLTSMPPPPPGASSAWCQERLALVIDEVAARVPMDAAQGHLAAQCVLAEFLAEDMSARLRTPGLTMMERRQVNNTADKLMCTVTRMERALERRQARVMPFRDVGAVEGFDLDALEGVWRRGMPGLVAAEPRGSAEARAVEQPAAPGAVVAIDPMKRELMGREPVEHAATAVPGSAEAEPERGRSGVKEGTGASDGRDRRDRAGVTLEQGDGWSLEVWPAGAGASATRDLAGQGALTGKGGTSGAATADGAATSERAATGRPGSRGAA